MKLHISFDIIDLEKTLEIASQVAEYADILEVGSPLIYAHGLHAVEEFKKNFPNNTILTDTKIVDRSKQIVPLLSNAGSDWITVMAGTSKNVIHRTCTAAHNANMKIMLDILDASSAGQAALEAKTVGADAILFYQPYDEEESFVFLDKWDMIKGNTDLPIFVAAKVTRENIEQIIKLQPDGIIIGSSITQAESPAEEAKFFRELIG